MSATFVFLMFALKIPICGLLYIVWWAIHQEVEPEPVTDEDGGTKKPREPSPRHPRHPHPRPTLPRPSRRGPHGAPALASPPRTRTVVARARRVEH